MSQALSSLSDDDLNAMYQRAQQPAAPLPLSQMSDDDLKALHAQQTNMVGEGRKADVASGNLLTDIPRVVGTATVNALAGGASLPRLAASGVDWLGRRVGADLGAEKALASIPAPTDPRYSMFPDYQTARDVLFRGTGATELVPQTEPGKVGMSALTGAIMAGHPAAMVAGAGAGAGSQLGADAAEHMGIPPTIPALLGGLAGGLVTGRVAQMPFGTPAGKVRPEVAELAKDARDQGIPIRGGQISENRFVRYLDSELGNMPFSGMDKQNVAQREAFGTAASKTIGEGGATLPPDTMSAARTRIGAAMEDVAQRSPPIGDPTLGQSLASISQDAMKAPTAAASIKNNIASIVKTLEQGGGTMTGADYQSLTRYNRPLSRAMQSIDPDTRFYARQIRNALDDALQRVAPPDLQKQLTDARRQWSNMMVLSDNVEKSAVGDVNPRTLLGDVIRNRDNVAFNGGGELGDLGRIGRQFMTEPPQSGTAARSAVHAAVPDPTAVGIAKTLAGRLLVDPLAGAIMRSDAYTNRLINSGTNPASVVMRQPTGLARAMIADMASREAASRLQPPNRQ